MKNYKDPSASANQPALWARASILPLNARSWSETQAPTALPWQLVSVVPTSIPTVVAVPGAVDGTGYPSEPCHGSTGVMRRFAELKHDIIDSGAPYGIAGIARAYRHPCAHLVARGTDIGIFAELREGRVDS